METNKRILDESAWKRLLTDRKTTRKHFKINLPYEQLNKLMTIAYKCEVESYGYNMVDNSEIRHHISAVSHFLSENDKHFGLILLGPVGGGKTTIVRAMQNLVSKLGENNDELINIDRNHYSTGTKVKIEMIEATEVANIFKRSEKEFNELCNMPILAIDDLGVEPTDVMSYGNIISPLSRLLEKRYEARLFTIITSNLAPQDITRKYGARIGDRLSEYCKIDFSNDKSYRRYAK